MTLEFLDGQKILPYILSLGLGRYGIVCVCMHVCAYVRTCIYIYIYGFRNRYIDIDMDLDTCTYTYVYKYAYRHT